MRNRTNIAGMAFLAIFALSAIVLSTQTTTHDNATKMIWISPSTGPSALNSNQTGNDWPMFRGGLNCTGTSSTAPSTSSGPVWVPYWTYPAGHTSMGSVTVANGRVYSDSSTGGVYCVNATTGASIWTVVSGQAFDYQTPAIAGDYVYVGSTDDYIHCLNASTGADIWDYTDPSLSGAILCGSAAVADGLVYMASAQGGSGTIYCLNATDGTFDWSYVTDNGMVGSVAISNGSLFVANGNAHVFCVNATTGTGMWECNLTMAVDSDPWGTPAVAYGCVYLGTTVSGNVYCLNASTGTVKWSSVSLGGFIQSSPAVSNDLVYVGSYSGVVGCLNASTGTSVWNYTTGDQVESSPAVASGHVYIGSDDGHLYCLNDTTGAKAWSFNAGQSVIASPAIAGGRVYMIVPTGTMYSFSMILSMRIVITSDSQWAAIANGGGDGSAGNPYIIQNFVIDCNYVGTGISVTGTNDYVIFNNIQVNDSGTVYPDAGIWCQGANHITFVRVNVTNCYAGMVFLDCSECDINDSFSNESTLLGLYFEGVSYFIAGNDSFITSTSAPDVDVGNILTGNSSKNIIFDTCLFSNATGATGDDLYVSSASDVTVSNSNFTGTGAVTFNAISGIDIESTYIGIPYALNFGSACTSVTIHGCRFPGTSTSAVLMTGGSNITILNCTCTNSQIDTSNLIDYTISGCTITGGKIYTSGCTNGTISYNHVRTTGTDAMVVSGNGINVTGNTVTGANYGLLLGGTDINVTSNYIENATITAVQMSGTNVSFWHNTITAPSLDDINEPDGVIIVGGTNISFYYNTFENINDSHHYPGHFPTQEASNGYGIVVSPGVVNLTVEYNTFDNVQFAINVNIITNFIAHYNHFIKVHNPFENMSAANTTCAGFSHNYYSDYFDQFPNAVLANLTSNVLAIPYRCSYWRSHDVDPYQIGHDLYPLYDPTMYPIEKVVNLQIDSAANNVAIPIGYLVVRLSGAVLTTMVPVIPSILFDIEVTYLNGTVLSNVVYNFNATGPYLRILVNAVSGASFSFYSTIDYFGLDFSLVKLYVNGTRINRPDPLIIPEISDIVVKDFANVTVYHKVLNLASVGTSVDIGLPVANVIIGNLYTYTTVDLYLSETGTTVMYQLSPSAFILLHLATGTYSYYALNDSDGSTLYGNRTVAISGARSISLGFATVRIPPNPTLTFTWLDTLISIAVFVSLVLVGAISYIIIYYRPINNRVKAMTPRKI